ncbi:MAG: glycine cleavage system protein H [Gammaproteobacteria bacterium 28-57-27]|nr:MAG: glycine cleavage system protein H [Gammaproteobacteria bacterium 28-57-27]
MSGLPENLSFTDSHAWLRQDDDGLVTLGVTEYGQSLLGDLVFIQFPEVGAHIDEGDVIVTLESVKSAWDVLAPVPMTIEDINAELLDQPERVNEEAFGEGWLVRVRVEEGLDMLMDADAYKDFVSE